MGRDTALKNAETSLARGEYRECLSLLRPLLIESPLSSERGAQIGILMITAFIGQANNQKAMDISKELAKHKNESIRNQAKQFINILSSPELERPKEWSVKIPTLDFKDSITCSTDSPSPEITT